MQYRAETYCSTVHFRAVTYRDSESKTVPRKTNVDKSVPCSCAIRMQQQNQICSAVQLIEVRSMQSIIQLMCDDKYLHGVVGNSRVVL